jgi:hypothetical protein
MTRHDASLVQPRTEYVRPEATESVADFLLALGVMGLLVLAGFAWFAVASASQAVPA